ncbi:MAG: DNA repair protein RecN [Spirochaetales bacterium]|nr:DNA repair protein RecN [Spirochaetales bacterium]
MLNELHIKDFALIDRLELSFSKGLNIFTGETGAGKSIIIGALGLILGEKGDIENIRTGQDSCVVSANISVNDNPEALAWLSENAIEAEQGELIIRRVLHGTKRSSCFIQSTPVTQTQLKEFTSTLFDIHGQHQHQSLLDTENHRKLLDNFAGLTEEVADFSEKVKELSSLKKHYGELVSAERDHLREIDYLQHALSEIDEAGLKPGEEDELKAEKDIISQAERLFREVDEFASLLLVAEGGALGPLGSALKRLSSLTEIDSKVLPLLRRFETAFYELEDIGDSIRRYREGITFSPERLEEIEERFMLIRKLTKKYGDTIPAVLAYRGEADRKINSLENWQTEKGELEERISELEKHIRSTAVAISQKRKSVAPGLGEEILAIVRRLGMKKAQLTIDVRAKMSKEGKNVLGPTGMDDVEFLFSSNQGEPLKPLSKIVSGGELSRVMLAVKTILAQADNISTLVFDEIDTGIGGEVALDVGAQMQDLAVHKQILCITHLASIAVRADNHIKVEKKVLDGRTLTEIGCMNGSERISEIARMLSGDPVGEASLAHAAELLNRYARK